MFFFFQTLFYLFGYQSFFFLGVVRTLLIAGGHQSTRKNAPAEDLELPILGPVDLERGTIYGTPLGVACAGGKIRCATLLLDAGANVNGIHDASSEWQTPLFLAAENGKSEMIELLLDRCLPGSSSAARHDGDRRTFAPPTDATRCDLDFASKTGKTPLFIACEKGQADCAKLLGKKKRFFIVFYYIFFYFQIYFQIFLSSSEILTHHFFPNLFFFSPSFFAPTPTPHSRGRCQRLQANFFKQIATVHCIGNGSYCNYKCSSQILDKNGCVDGNKLWNFRRCVNIIIFLLFSSFLLGHIFYFSKKMYSLICENNEIHCFFSSIFYFLLRSIHCSKEWFYEN